MVLALQKLMPASAAIPSAIAVIVDAPEKEIRKVRGPERAAL